METLHDLDTTLTVVHGVEILADATDNQHLVDACLTVLDAVLDARLHVPQPRKPS